MTRSRMTVFDRYHEDESRCPFCDSDNLDFGSFEYDRGKVTQEVRCKTCGAIWTGIYRLASIQISAQHPAQLIMKDGYHAEVRVRKS